MTLEEVMALTDEEAKAVRERCVTDLFFLATEVLGYDFTEEVHGPVCDFFVKKVPGVELEQLDVIKDRLLLDGREHYKTTADVADCVQWIIYDPNIRIGLWSGEETLAKQIMNMVKGHFKYNEVFRALFFEHAVDPKDKKNDNVFEFITPARSDWRLREPTLSISTIRSVSTGGHYNIIKYDDIITPQNSETKEQLAITIDRVRQTHPLLIVGGYRDFIGTRYHFADTYGWIIDNADDTWRIFNRGAYTPSVDGEGNPIPPNAESKVLFTINRIGKKAFDYKELLKRFKEMGPQMFGCQYLNNPQWGEAAMFPEKLLREQCIPYNQIPLIVTDIFRGGQMFRNIELNITWDTAYSKKKRADDTVGIVGGFDPKGNLYIIDMVKGRLSPDEFVYQFFYLFKKWLLWMGRIGIEESTGAPMIEPSLKAHANNMQMGLPIDWLPLKRDTTKEERVFGLLPLLKARKLFFNKDMVGIEDLIKQFKEFPKGGKDDIPDSCQMQLKYQGVVQQQRPLSHVPQFPQTANPLNMDRLLGYGLVG